MNANRINFTAAHAIAATLRAEGVGYRLAFAWAMRQMKAAWKAVGAHIADAIDDAREAVSEIINYVEGTMSKKTETRVEYANRICAALVSEGYVNSAVWVGGSKVRIYVNGCGKLRRTYAEVWPDGDVTVSGVQSYWIQAAADKVERREIRDEPIEATKARRVVAVHSCQCSGCGFYGDDCICL